MIHMALAGVLGIGIILSCQHASSLAAAVLHQWPTEILPTCSWTWPEKYFPPSVIYLFPPDDLSRFTGNCGASRSRRDKELELRLRHRFRHAIIQRGGPQPWKEDLLPTTEYLLPSSWPRREMQRAGFGTRLVRHTFSPWLPNPNPSPTDSRAKRW